MSKVWTSNLAIDQVLVKAAEDLVNSSYWDGDHLKIFNAELFDKAKQEIIDISTPKVEPPKDETLMGQLIAEIAKFGGFDKTKASQLARILLPHIKLQQEALLNRVEAEIGEPAFGLPGVIEIEQVKNIVNKLRLEL